MQECDEGIDCGCERCYIGAFESIHLVRSELWEIRFPLLIPIFIR